MVYFMMNFLEKLLFCQFNFRKRKRPVGKTVDGKNVYRCEQTNLLYVLTEPTKKYVNLSNVVLKSEKQKTRAPGIN